MKIICSSAFLLALLSGGGFSQSAVKTAAATAGAAESPAVEVVKKDWRFEVRNPALEESPFVAMDERVDEEADQRQILAENQRRAKLGIKPAKLPERPPVERQDGPASGAYIYEIKIKNTGDRPISSLVLEYLFFDPDSAQEVGRRQFNGKEQISPGKTKTLVFRSASPPTGSINAKDVAQKKKPKYTEQVFVRSVKFADGTGWEAPIKEQHVKNQ